jgi:hypothetical protein
MTISPASSSLHGGQTVQFTVGGAASYTNGTSSWSVTPQLGTISAAGLYTAPATVTTQTVTVKAALASNSAIYVTAAVALTPAASTTYSVAASMSGSSLIVTWSAPSGASSGDSIALASPGGPDWWNLWSGSTKGATSGSFTVPRPANPGLYEFRYYKSSGGTPAARSSALAINVSAFRVTPSLSTVSKGGKVTVSWTAPSGRPGNWGDTIGLYKVGTTNDNAVSYVYPQGSAGGTTSGTYTLTAPSASGSYELRYILATGGYIAEVVTPLTVQ